MKKNKINKIKRNTKAKKKNNNYFYFKKVLFPYHISGHGVKSG